MTWREFADRFLRVRKCGGCESVLTYEEREAAFCGPCELRYRAAKVESCPNCFQSAIACTCMPKGLSEVGALCLRKLYFYRSSRAHLPQNKMIYYLKHKPNRRMTSFLAAELREAIEQELSILGVEERARSCVWVSVPRSRKSRNRYGFDQSELFGRVLSEQSGIPYACVIRRRFGGKEQKRLSVNARFRNIRHLFSIRDREAVRGKCVLLFDDIVTTGASMAACVKLLREAGARSVICFCLAQNQKDGTG